MATLSTADINNLPDSDFAYIEPGGSKDDGGRTVPRSLRHFPIPDAAHVRNAFARIGQGAEFGKEAMPKLMAAAKKYGVDTAMNTAPATASRAAAADAWPARITRSVALEDLTVRAGRINCDTCGRDATGRVVDAYAGVFNQTAVIVDDDGSLYEEDIDPAAWNRRLEQVSRARAGLRSVQVFYNHGHTLEGTPSESASHPLGHPMAIRADHYGLLTSTHYGSTDYAERVFTDVKDGNVTGHSFTGNIYRSDPQRRPRAQRGAPLPKVRRLELGLDEYGPSPLAYYEGADLVAVRAGALAQPAELAEPERERIVVTTQANLVRKIEAARLQGYIS